MGDGLCIDLLSVHPGTAAASGTNAFTVSTPSINETGSAVRPGLQPPFAP